MYVGVRPHYDQRVVVGGDMGQIVLTPWLTHRECRARTHLSHIIPSVCAVCADDYYPSGSYECLPCTAADAAGTAIMVM